MFRGDARNNCSVSAACFFDFLSDIRSHLISSLDSPKYEGGISYIIGSHVCESLEVLTRAKGMDQPCGCAIDGICELSVGDFAVALIVSQVGHWILGIDSHRCQCGALVNEMWKQVSSELEGWSVRTLHSQH